MAATRHRHVQGERYNNMKKQNYRLSWSARNMCTNGTFGWFFSVWKYNKRWYARIFGRYFDL